jgi:AcrR family transcriptional regulator
MTDVTLDKEPDTRERILIEASRLLSLNGYRGTTTRDIATAVGISQPSLFFHFPTKQAIVEELYRSDLIPALQGFERLVASQGSPAAKLFAMIAGEVRRVIGSPFDTRAYMSFEALNDPDLEPFRDLLQQFDDLTGRLIRAGQDSGQFIKGDPWLAQQMVSGFLARSTLFLTDDERSLPFHPDNSAALILRALLRDQDDLDALREEAAKLAPEYRAGP